MKLGVGQGRLVLVAIDESVRQALRLMLIPVAKAIDEVGPRRIIRGEEAVEIHRAQHSERGNLASTADTAEENAILPGWLSAS